jgi:hypothetical protein
MNDADDMMNAYLELDELEMDAEGGFQKIKKQTGKVSRQDSKRIPKSERKKIKKQRRQEKHQEMIGQDDWQFV